MTEILSRYERHLRAQGYAPSTIRAKVGVVDLVSRDAGAVPDQLTREQVEAFLDRDLSPWSRRKYLEHLGEFARWAGVPSPVDGLRRPRVPSSLPRPVSEPDLARILAAAQPRTRAFVILGAYAGLRSFEIAKVAAEDFIATATGPGLLVMGKAGRRDLLPVPAVLVDELEPWRRRAGAGPLWPGVRAHTVQIAIKELSTASGVRFTCHQLRHRYGTALYAASRDLLVVQQLMRHSSPTTTAGYALVVPAAGTAVVQQLALPLVS